MTRKIGTILLAAICIMSILSGCGVNYKKELAGHGLGRKALISL